MRSLMLSSFPLILVLAAACPVKVATVEVTPPRTTIKSEAETTQLKATPKNEAGETIEGEKVAAWTSSNPAVAAVDKLTGKVKPTGSGKVTITAKIDEVSGTSAVEVILLKGMKLESPAMVIKAGATNAPLKIAFSNEKGELIEVRDQKVEWKSADPNIATVGADGAVAGVAPGSTTVSARVEGLTADVAVTVNPASPMVDAGPGPTATP